MERSFIAGTALASALVFAGVWAAAAPSPASIQPVAADTVEASGPDTAAVIQHEPTIRGLPESPPARDTGPYNVVRSAYGSATPAGRSASRSESAVFYSGCREVRAAGAAPIYRGQPGYRPGMDGDNDGIACEPYR